MCKLGSLAVLCYVQDFLSFLRSVNFCLKGGYILTSGNVYFSSLVKCSSFVLYTGKYKHEIQPLHRPFTRSLICNQLFFPHLFQNWGHSKHLHTTSGFIMYHNPLLILCWLQFSVIKGVYILLYNRS